MTARHTPDGQIAPPERTADGTGARRYAPIPGDVVEVRAGALVAYFKAHGVRLGSIDREAGPGAVYVMLPGYRASIRLEVEDLTLVWRRPPESTP